MSGYSAKDIQVLKEIEHIQLNPGMYIGSTQDPTHLVEEALDNALDEALAGYAEIIAVLLDQQEHRYVVMDSGRGIPLENNMPVVIASKLFSGAKFHNKKTAYEISSGLHGVGLVAVNALSEYFCIEVYRDGKHGTFEFRNSKLKRSEIKKFGGKVPFSTKIEFVPDSKYFEKLEVNLDRLHDRLTVASAELPKNVSFVLRYNGRQEVFSLDKHQLFRNYVKTNDCVITELSSEKNPEKFDVLFTYQDDGAIAPHVFSSVNLLPVSQGGSHVNFFYDLLRNFFVSKAKKYNFKFQPNDALCKLRAYLSLNLKEPKFSSQTKDTLITSKNYLVDLFGKDLQRQLEKSFSDNEELFLDYLQNFQLYRNKLNAKKIVQIGSGKRASTKFTKLRDCTSRNGELYVVEGESAGGGIIQVRDVRKHAILPLKGKSIPNVTTTKDILNNQEIKELISAVGTNVGPDFDISKMRYDKIICATDADPDGAHITCLLTMAIAVLLPDIIKEGRYFLARTPLFAITEGKTFIPLWTNEELEKARKQGRRITRFKGLGELSPHQLKICLLDEATRFLVPVKFSSNIDELLMLFSDVNKKRELVCQNDSTFNQEL